MHHGKSYRKFSKSCSHRRAFFRNLATSFLQAGCCETTIEKAKDLRPIVEKLVTLGKEDSLHRRRLAYSYLQDKSIVHKLFAEISPKYKERPGGYTRILRTRLRHGDSAQLALIELI